MKINPFMTIIALLLAAVVAFAMYSYCKSEASQWMITCLGGVSIFLTWAGTLAVELEEKGKNVSFKVLGGLIAVIMTGLQIFCTCSAVTMPTYVLVTGVTLLLWLAVAYALAK